MSSLQSSHWLTLLCPSYLFFCFCLLLNAVWCSNFSCAHSVLSTPSVITPFFVKLFAFLCVFGMNLCIFHFYILNLTFKIRFFRRRHRHLRKDFNLMKFKTAPTLHVCLTLALSTSILCLQTFLISILLSVASLYVQVDTTCILYSLGRVEK